jgi:hypothetical protein
MSHPPKNRQRVLDPCCGKSFAVLIARASSITSASRNSEALASSIDGELKVAGHRKIFSSSKRMIPHAAIFEAVKMLEPSRHIFR